MIVSLVIDGAPRTKKNHQRIMKNKRTGKPFIMQAKTHDDWATKAKAQLFAQMKLTPITTPVRMSAVVYRERATGDLLNYLAAISDVLEASGVVANDRQIVSLDGCRMDKDAKRPRVEITIETLEGP